MAQITDVFGTAAAGETLKSTVEGVGTFIGRICNPAADEIGLLIRDKVASWRANNIRSLENKAETKYKEMYGSACKVTHPRLVAMTINTGSWIDDDLLQTAWANLLVSSCDDDGKDDSGLIFMNLLNQLVSSQIKLINYSCRECPKEMDANGLITNGGVGLMRDKAQIMGIMGINDIHRIDREMDHLTSIGLLAQGFHVNQLHANISPTPLAFNLYVRCQGYSGSPCDFFHLKPGTFANEPVLQPIVLYAAPRPTSTDPAAVKPPSA